MRIPAQDVFRFPEGSSPPPGGPRCVLESPRRQKRGILMEGYSPDEPRDDHGRWSGGTDSGQTFNVFRVQRAGNRDLGGRDAADLPGAVQFALSDNQELTEGGDRLAMYRVTNNRPGQFGRYEPARGGQTPGDGIGRETHELRWPGDTARQAKWYSFGRTGYTAEFVRDVPLAEVVRPDNEPEALAVAHRLFFGGIRASGAKQRLILAARNGSVFTAKSLGAQTDSAARQLAKYLKAVERDIQGGASIRDAVPNSGYIRSVVRSLALSARLRGYMDGALHLRRTMPALYGSQVQKTADQRGTDVDRYMRQTTQRQLKLSRTGSFITSAARASRAAHFEAARSYFGGLQDVLRGSGTGKMWITSGGNSCPQCLANEEAGIIDADDDWDGEETPPIHLNCECSIGVIKQ